MWEGRKKAPCRPWFRIFSSSASSMSYSTAGWRASPAIQGFVRYSIMWRRLEIIPRHTKCIFFSLVHSTPIFSRVVTAVITKQNYNYRYPFSEALPLPWMMSILNMSAHLLWGYQQPKLLDGLNYLQLLFGLLVLSWCQYHTREF